MQNRFKAVINMRVVPFSFSIRSASLDEMLIDVSTTAANEEDQERRFKLVEMIFFFHLV